MYHAVVHWAIKFRNQIIDFDQICTDNAAQNSKIKLAANLYLLLALISLVYLPILLILQLYLQGFFALITLGLNVFLLRYLKRKNGVQVTAHVLCAAIFVISVLQMFYTQGDVNFVTISWLIVSIIFSFFQIGRKTAFLYLVASVFLMLIFVLLKIAGFSFPDYKLSALYYYLGSFVSLALVFGFIFIIIEQYERHSNRLLSNLKASESRLQNMVENLPTAVFYRYQENVFCNKKFIALTGYQHFSFNTIHQVLVALFPSLENIIYEILVLNKQNISSRGWLLKTLQNEEKIVTLHYYQELNHEILTINDISELKNSEALIQKSNYFIENMAKAMPHILFIFDLQKETNIYTSKSVLNLLKFTLPELQAFPSIYQLAHPEDISLVKTYVNTLKELNDTQTSTIEYRLKDKSGNFLWMRSTQKVFKRNSNGIPIQVIGVAENITDAKIKELRTQKNLFFLQNINQHTHLFSAKNFTENVLSEFFQSGAKIIDAESIALYKILQNDNKYQNFKLKYKWSKHSQSNSKNTETPEYLTQQIHHFESNKLLKTSSHKSSVAVPVFIDEKLWGIVDFVFHPNNESFQSIFDDVWKNFGLYLTGLFLKQKLEKEILIEKSKVERSSNAKSVFLNSISHEINTPLHIISGTVELLNTEHTNNNEAHKFLLLKHAADDLKYLIEQIVTFNKLQEEEMYNANTPFSFTQWLNALEKEWTTFYSKANKPITWHLDSRLTDEVIGNAVKIRHIIKSILLHSLNSKSNKPIAVQIVLEKETNNFYEIKFSISDLPSNEMPSPIHTEPYSENISSLGINLFVAFHLVQSLKGKKLNYIFEKGTHFSFSLSFEKNLKNKSNTSYNIEGKKILVVDDNEINVLIIKKYLNKKSAIVQSVTNGKAAIELLQNEKFDVVLLDWFMPDMDGGETMSQLQKKSITTPVIAVSAAAYSEIEAQIKANNIFAFLPKPINPELLLQKIYESCIV